METAEFDDLIDSIVETLRSIREARAEVPPVWSERFLVRDEDGRVVPRTLAFRPPAEPGEAAGETVQVSLADVVPPVEIALASLSVEMDCVLEEVPAREARGERRMRMRLRGREDKRREGVDRVRITVRGGDPIEATAYVNGKPFKTVQ